MQYVILLISLFIFLFTLFALSREDFVLFRRNVDMEKVFNIAFLTVGIGLFFARLVFVMLYFKPVYLNPLAFVLFPYFPGLSLAGGLLGASIGLAVLLRGKKYPEGRLFDFFILSFTVALLAGICLQLLTSYVATKQVVLPFIAELILGLIIFLLSLRVFKNHAMKEGSVGLVLVFFFSLIFIGAAFLQKSVDMIPWIVVFLTSLVFFLRQERVSSFLKLLGKK